MVFYLQAPLLMPSSNGHSPPSSDGESDRETVSNREFAGERLIIDGKHFEDCTFETCTLVFRGGTPPNFVRCDFAAPQFAFEAAAKNTVQLMSAIHNGIDPRIIERTFDVIRDGFGDE